MKKSAYSPLEEMLCSYDQKNVLRFHMPGHKGRRADFPARWDVTELPDTDDWRNPQGAILQANRALAKAYRADSAFLLANGSTAGIQAMMLWCAMHSLPVVLPRDVHLSAIHACALADIQPEWASVPWNETYGISAAPVYENCTGKAVLATYPDYYGRCLPLSQLKEKSGVAALLVDEAHGAHFAFSSYLPRDAGELGADAWVAGAHKTLPAPTQSAYLLSRKELAGELFNALKLCSTTSPSFLLMTGADSARAFMEGSADRLEWLMERCETFRRHVDALSGLKAFDQCIAREMGYESLDPTRLVVDVSGRGLSGWQAAEKLRENVAVEMADARRIVLIATVMDEEEDFTVLEKAIASIKGNGRAKEWTVDPLPMPEIRMTLREALLSPRKEIPLSASARHVAAESAGCYPPGTPLWMPGELISPEAVETMQRVAAGGGTIFGIREGLVQVIR